MRNFKLILQIFIVISYAEKAFQGSANKERNQYYECGNKFFNYNLDDDPAKYGLNAGISEKEKLVYVGIVDANNFIVTGQIQLSPPGASYFANFSSFFTNDSSKIWYLYRNDRHKYEWIDSENGEDVKFAIDYGSDTIGSKAFIGRIVYPNKNIVLGVVLPNTGVMYYVNSNGIGTATQTNYQVLTCKSFKRDKKVSTPKHKQCNKPLPPEIGCLNKWIEFKDENEILKNGIEAGLYENGIKSYVGKGEHDNCMIPGRIQTAKNAGFHFLAGGKEIYMKKGSFYLANNDNYTYYWVNFDGDFPENTVYARSNYLIPIARAKINGHINIGYVLGYQAHFPCKNSSHSRYSNYEILVCDPWPKYRCGQEWKKLDKNSKKLNNGINIDIYKDDMISYIARGKCNQFNECDFEFGKLENNSSAALYLNDLTSSERIDQSSVEYLVKNANYVYKWIPSCNGVKVENAMELQKNGNRPFYFGVTKINDNIFAGKVRPGEGLYFFNLDGVEQSTNVYNVLTCTSPESNNDVNQERSDRSWYGPFGCNIRQEWNYKLWKCVCRDDFRGIFTSNNVQWNENTCSYSIN